MISADVLVVGAGPAGAAAAISLSREGRSVFLLDGDTNHEFKIGESLPGCARPLLRDLGALEAMRSNCHSPCRGNVSFWGSDDPIHVDSIRDPHGPGWHLDRVRFDAMLREVAVNSGVVLEQGRMQKVLRVGDDWRIWLGSGERITSRWVLDASGRSSTVALRLGARRIRDTRLVALFARCKDTSGDQRTIVEAVPEGWWYSALLPGQTRVAALHLRAEEAGEFKNLDRWLECLARTRHVHLLCDQEGTWTVPQGVDAGGAMLDEVCGQGWLAVGDAALSFDPLSSQGLFNALSTGLRGAQATHAALEGDSKKPRQYGEQLREVRRIYQERVLSFYRGEQRWPEQAFWKERHLAA